MQNSEKGRRSFIRKSLGAGMLLSLDSEFSFSISKASFKKIGIIGLDTSHSVAFTKLINDPQAPEELAGFQVTAAYPPGSLDIESSVNRIPGYTEEIQNFGVKIAASLEELLDQVDFVLLETNDGRRHLEQALPVFKAGKPVFIDKPVAASLADVFAIYQAARKYQVPVFSASSLRYLKNGLEARNGKLVGAITGADAYSPAHLEPTHPDLYWYGIHGVETLFTVMGPGCREVVRVNEQGTDLAVGTWEDGRIGTFRGIRTGKSGYGGVAYGENGILPVGPYEGYRPLVVEILQFFRTGKPPVEENETLEIYGFMAAADESKKNGGKPVALEQVMEKAKKAAEKLI